MEPTASELQAQLDRLSLTLQMEREPKNSLEPVTQQLSRLAERCQDILNRWSEADALHAHLVSEAEQRLTEWGVIENRLEQDYSTRLRQLEQVISTEWQTLRRIHEEPVKQLRQEAAALSEVCVSAANLALQGFERAEARLDAFEQNLQTQLGRLSEDVQAALLEGRREAAHPALPSQNVAPFPLEGVMRIHDDLRETEERPTTPALSSAHVESLERDVMTERHDVPDTAVRVDDLRRMWRLAVGAIGLVTVLASIIGIVAQRRLNARLDEAGARVAAAERRAEEASAAANQQIAATRADAERQIAQAKQSALEAGIVSGVLAAPDLIRFNLVGTDKAQRAYAQVLWSRSRGFVLSASQLPALAEGTTYQVWLLSDSGAASVGTVAPDGSGRATLAVDNPPGLPRAVNGVSVTLESSTTAATTPSTTPVLVRLQQQ